MAKEDADPDHACWVETRDTGATRQISRNFVLLLGTPGTAPAMGETIHSHTTHLLNSQFARPCTKLFT